MNKIFLIGNLTADPEMRTTTSGVNFCTMNIAVNPLSRSDNAQPQFFRITVWRQLGETCSRFLSKGKKVCVMGELTARTYEGKDGTTRVSLEVNADTVEFLSPRGTNESTPAADGQGYQRQYPKSNSGTNTDITSGWAEIDTQDFPF